MIGDLLAVLPWGGRHESSDGTADVETHGGLQTRLFHCSDCGRTFIATSKESCTRCGTAVEEVPTEMDLDSGAADA